MEKRKRLGHVSLPEMSKTCFFFYFLTNGGRIRKYSQRRHLFVIKLYSTPVSFCQRQRGLLFQIGPSVERLGQHDENPHRVSEVDELPVPRLRLSVPLFLQTKAAARAV